MPGARADTGATATADAGGAECLGECRSTMPRADAIPAAWVRDVASSLAMMAVMCDLTVANSM